LSEIGAAHTIAAPINTPMMLIFFMAVSRLELHRTSRALALIQVKEWACLQIGRYLRDHVDHRVPFKSTKKMQQCPGDVRFWLRICSLIPGLGVKALHDHPCRAHCSLRGRGVPSA